MSESLRAEEIIAEVYRQITYIRSKKQKPKRIILKKSLWDTVMAYRMTLGDLPADIPDYIAEDKLFGLDIWYDSGEEIRVE